MKNNLSLFIKKNLKKYVSLIVIVGITLASFIFIGTAAAEQDTPIVVHVNVKEYSVELSQTTLPANTPITFVVTSEGTVAHETVLEKAGDEDNPLNMNGESAEIEDVNPGESKSATWVINQPGEYQLACHVPGHYQGGMVALFSVNPTGLAGMAGRPTFWFGFIGLLILLVIAADLVIRRVNRSAAQKPGPTATA